VDAKSHAREQTSAIGFHMHISICIKAYVILLPSNDASLLLAVSVYYVANDGVVALLHLYIHPSLTRTYCIHKISERDNQNPGNSMSSKSCPSIMIRALAL